MYKNNKKLFKLTDPGAEAGAGTGAKIGAEGARGYVIYNISKSLITYLNTF
jgi:hypothetical protein